MRRAGFVYHPAYLRHDTGRFHPESPDRLLAIEARIKKSGIYDQLVTVDPPSSPRADIEQWIAKVHQPSHIQRIRENIPSSGQTYLDPDTPISPYSYLAAQLAVEGTLDAADKVMSGELASVFCSLRPPGHHAESNRAMGFCLFNNVAVCVRYLQEQHGSKKVAIIDWDVHHGNGTQQIFYEDPTVLYFSIHQFPLYPGTGSEKEVGAGPGEGYTINCPLPPGRGDDHYVDVFEKVLVPSLKSFGPDFILISAGFDAHRDDPLANMQVTEAGFGELTRIVKRYADALCQGRIISCLEGGYNLGALARSVEQHLIILME
jgi:acetoin utilization deacetylase AcuC-like enzyme